MNRIPLLALLLAAFTGCASSTVIRTNPPGATVRNSHGQVVGKTPHFHEDTEINNYSKTYRLELEGHKETSVTIRRNQANPSRLIGFGLGGIFIWPVWAGLLWSSDYKSEYQVELEPEPRGKKSAHAR